MELVSAVVLLVEFFIFLPIIVYYGNKGKTLPKENSLPLSKFLKVILVIANKIFTYILWLVAPILILLNFYRPILFWTTFAFFLPSSYNYFWFQVIGMIVFSIGLIFIILARFVIKEYHAKPWEPSKKGTSFAKTGIYSKIRHPIYTAVFFFLIGYSLWFQSWLALACFILSLTLIKSAVAEESWLLKRFGREYEKYMNKTGRFFPKLRINDY